MVLALGALAALSGAGCRARQADAAAYAAPVCGVDGHVYDDAAAARAAHIALAETDRCRALVPGWAPCGARYCDARTSYCEIYLSDAPEIPTGRACRPLPTACGSPASCDCLAPGLAGRPAFCGQIVTGGLAALHVTFQGVKEPIR
ncbi:MAG TPA: hypothetical protein VHJ20_11895 [Polyangia bacterium]|nr:hypothetical protein [Polyangia bacterium]